MKRRTAAAALAVLVVSSSQALAWNPVREDRQSEPVAPQASREPDPAPFIAPPPDLYYVTDTYVADVVTSTGLVTTYSTSTIHESTGSYARVLETVATGASRSSSPRPERMPAQIAVVWSGSFNFLGVLLSSGAVAFGIISLLPVELILQVGSSAGFAMVFALLIAAIIWNLGTWYLGQPASSSHTLIGSIIGVGIATVGWFMARVLYLDAKSSVPERLKATFPRAWAVVLDRRAGGWQAVDLLAGSLAR